MKKAEIIIGVLSIYAITLYLLYIPGGVLLTVLMLQALACLYFLLSFALLNGVRLRMVFKKESYENITGWRMTGAICAGFALSIAITGILFHILTWPGAFVNQVIGLGSVAIVFIISTIKYFQKKSKFYRGIIGRVIIIGGIALISFMTDGNTLVDIRYRNYPALRNAIKVARNSNRPYNDSLWEKADEERDIVEAGKDSASLRKYYQSRRNRKK